MSEPSLPYRSFKLSVAARAQMRHEIDLDALEWLLSSVPEHVRDFLQRAFASVVPVDFGIEDLLRGGDAPHTHVAGRSGGNPSRRNAHLPF